MKKQVILLALLFSVIFVKSQTQVTGDLRIDKSVTMKGVRITDISIDSSGTSKSGAKLVTEKAAKNYADSAALVKSIGTLTSSVLPPLVGYKWNYVNGNSINTGAFGWVDGTFIWTVNDTMRLYGGWNTPNITYDSIRRSTDGGATWIVESFRLPFPVHTVANVEKVNGWNYIIGADLYATTTQRKSVYRTNNGGRTWQLCTNNAPFSSILGVAFADENGYLYFGGGQADELGTLCDTLWRSTDAGCNWSIYATGMTILAGNKTNLAKYFNGRVVIATGGTYGGPFVYGKKTYSFDIKNPKAWVEHDDYPTATGRHFASAIVWDNKYWIIGGNDASANQNNVYYLDLNYKWNLAPNYHSNNPAALLQISHATGTGLWRGKLVYGVGNFMNSTYTLETAPVFGNTNFKDTATINVVSANEIYLNNYNGTKPITFIDTDFKMKTDAYLNYNAQRLKIGIGNVIYPLDRGLEIYNSEAGKGIGINMTNEHATAFSTISFIEGTTSYGGISRYGSGFGGNYTSTSVPYAASAQIQAGNSNQQNLVISSGALIHNVGVSSTNTGLRSDANGLAIRTNATVHTANTYKFEVEGTSFLNGNVTIPGTVSNTLNWAAANGTPSNTTTAVGWVRISINGVAAWLPYYQ